MSTRTPGFAGKRDIISIIERSYVQPPPGCQRRQRRGPKTWAFTIDRDRPDRIDVSVRPGDDGETPCASALAGRASGNSLGSVGAAVRIPCRCPSESFTLFIRMPDLISGREATFGAIVPLSSEVGGVGFVVNFPLVVQPS
jgi:hypothetical protein